MYTTPLFWVNSLEIEEHTAMDGIRLSITTRHYAVFLIFCYETVDIFTHSYCTVHKVLPLESPQWTPQPTVTL